MSVGAFLEPLVIVVLLFGSTWINRNRTYDVFVTTSNRRWSSTSTSISNSGEKDNDSECGRRNLDSLRSLSPRNESPWRTRKINIGGLQLDAQSPNTAVFRDRFLSRVLCKFPFLVQAWYWALVYWVYQLGRAFTAVTLVEGTVHAARRHALQLILLEQELNIFWELDIQHFFLKQPFLMLWINRIYSFIHIPGTIIFLVWLYRYTTTRNAQQERQDERSSGDVASPTVGPELFDKRWRTMATCNLLAFIIFTAWPCMPPRLLSDTSVTGPSGAVARSYGFVDTVHGKNGEASVWTQNKFCNQYAAMPSLHFGYSLLIGLTIAMTPMLPNQRQSRTVLLPFNIRVRLPSQRRLLYATFGFLYPFTILVAIIATANHFILDAVAGAVVCGVAWRYNRILLNLLPLEDYFLWSLRIHKPDRNVIIVGMDGLDGKGVLELRSNLARGSW